jgi:hypothetical protein
MPICKTGDSTFSFCRDELTLSSATAIGSLVRETAPGVRPGGRVTFLLVQKSHQKST